MPVHSSGEPFLFISWMMMNQKEKNSQSEMATSIMDKQSNLCAQLLAWHSQD
uniref:Alternative protein RBPJ n=1 Tax=Homo sapiens TaxID=9606 RepID=L8E7S3_HUMAN|nr:alternative protein RBPJ [Homo sapiens]